MTSAAALVSALRARGVELRPDGDRLRVRPAEALAPDELAALRARKAEVLRVLARVPPPPPSPEAAPWRQPALCMETVREVLGADSADEHAVACVRFDVLAAVTRYEAGVRCGALPPRLLIRGRPLADWLDLADVARLLVMGGERRAEEDPK